MIALEVLSELRHRGVELFVAEGALRYRAPRGVLTPELRAALSVHKAELVAMLAPAAEPTCRLDLGDCMELIRDAFEAVASGYVEGALALLETDPDLCRRFHDTEAVIDAVVKAGPTAPALGAALTAHVAVIREACQRLRARTEAAVERPVEMPDLPRDTVAAVGFLYATGGAWVSIHRERTQRTRP